jgi:hypothetical protein
MKLNFSNFNLRYFLLFNSQYQDIKIAKFYYFIINY